MRNLLIINSSPNTDHSVSTALTSLFAEELQQDYHITVRDLGRQPPAHLDSLALSGFFY